MNFIIELLKNTGMFILIAGGFVAWILSTLWLAVAVGTWAGALLIALGFGFLITMGDRT